MINSISFLLLHVAEYFSYAQRLISIFPEAASITDPKLQFLVQALMNAFNLLDEGLKKSSTKLETKTLEAMDKLRDDAFKALKHIALAHSKRPDAAIREAAFIILNLIEGYGNQLYHDSKEKETAKLDNLLGDIETKETCINAVTTMNCGEFVTELKDAATAFKTSRQSRQKVRAENSELAKSEEGCDAIQKACESLFKYLDVMQENFPTDEQGAWISEINTVNNEYMAVIRARQTRNENNSEEE